MATKVRRRKSAKRSAAAKKAARTRKRNLMAKSNPVKRRRRRHHVARRANPIRRRRTHARRRRNSTRVIVMAPKRRNGRRRRGHVARQERFRWRAKRLETFPREKRRQRNHPLLPQRQSRRHRGQRAGRKGFQGRQRWRLQNLGRCRPPRPQTLSRSDRKMATKRHENIQYCEKPSTRLEARGRFGRSERNPCASSWPKFRRLKIHCVFAPSWTQRAIIARSSSVICVIFPSGMMRVTATC